MIMKRKRNISIVTALTAALVLLVTSETFAGNYGKQQSDIVDTAVSAGTFNTLAAALEAGDLVDTLKSDGPYTVFAPTDEAFAKLPDGTVEMLLMPENKDKLVAILTYHVVAGKVTAAEVITMSLPHQLLMVLTSLSRLSMKPSLSTIHGSSHRYEASNGIIHVVDSVILPN